MASHQEQQIALHVELTDHTELTALHFLCHPFVCADTTSSWLLKCCRYVHMCVCVKRGQIVSFSLRKRKRKDGGFNHYSNHDTDLLVSDGPK